LYIILCACARQAGLLPQIDAFPLLGQSEAARKPDTGWHLPKIFFKAPEKPFDKIQKNATY
jgi:hypothetical protein